MSVRSVGWLLCVGAVGMLLVASPCHAATPQDVDKAIKKDEVEEEHDVDANNPDVHMFILSQSWMKMFEDDAKQMEMTAHYFILY